MPTSIIPLACSAAFLAHAAAQPPASAPASPADTTWQIQEAAFLGPATQLTFPADYTRAGEAYFDPSNRWIVFQATQRPKPPEQRPDGAALPAKDPDPFYAMFVARLNLPGRDADATSAPALSNLERISPPDSANTCGWFHPTRQGELLMGSTITRPSDDQKSGFQVGSRRYVWMFPDEMEIVSVRSREVTRDAIATSLRDRIKNPNEALREDNDAKQAALVDKAAHAVVRNNPIKPVFVQPKYDAECSYDPSGRFILFTYVEPTSETGKPDGNIAIFDTKTNRQIPMVIAPGYDGGPFFSPDAKHICYRSDRAGNDLLQLFVAEVRYEADESGVQVPVGLGREWQITSNQHVNWAPYWHPSGEYLVYASSEAGHTNYEVFAAKLDWAAMRALPAPAPGTPPSTQPQTIDASSITRAVRITFAPGADVLPAFSNDGKYLLWTSQRGDKIEGETRPSSQLWIAPWKGLP